MRGQWSHGQVQGTYLLIGELPGLSGRRQVDVCVQERRGELEECERDGRGPSERGGVAVAEDVMLDFQWQLRKVTGREHLERWSHGLPYLG